MDGRVQIIKLLIMKLSQVFCYFNPLRSKYSPQHPVLEQPRVRRQVSHPHKTTGKIVL